VTPSIGTPRAHDIRTRWPGPSHCPGAALAKRPEAQTTAPSRRRPTGRPGAVRTPGRRETARRQAEHVG